MRRKSLLGIGTLFVLSILACVFLIATYRGLRQAQHDFALFAAIKSNDSHAAISALNAGADANARYTGEKPPSLRDQALLLLANLFPHKTEESSKRRLSALMYLFEREMDTPEHPQSSPGEVENSDIVKALLEHGADPNVRGSGRMTPLMRAALMDETDSLKLLLQHGADIHAKDEDGETALHHAATSITAADVQMLLAKGADIDAQAKHGETPLILAAYFDRIEIVPVLIAAHAALNRKDKDGYTALDHAQKKHADEVVALLRQAGATATTVADDPPPAPTPNVKKSVPSPAADVLALGMRSAVPEVENSQDSEAYFWVSGRQILWMQPDAAHKQFHLDFIDPQNGAKTPLDAFNAYSGPFNPVVKGGTVGYASTKEVIQLYPTPTSALSPDGKWLLWDASAGSPHAWRAATVDAREQRQWQNAPSTDNVFWLPDSRHWMQFYGSSAQSGYDRLAIYSLTNGEKPQKVQITGLGDIILLGVTNRKTVLAYEFNFGSKRSRVKMLEVGYSRTSESARRFTITLPKRADVVKMLLSPTGDRIAWIMDDGVTFSEKGEVWISDTTGHQMHLLGRLEGDMAFKRNLHWLPDGKHLSFRHQGDLWTVPVP